MRLQILAQAPLEIALHRADSGDAELTHAGLHARRALPLVRHHFIAPYVQVLAGKQRHHLPEDILYEAERRLIDIAHVRVDSPVRRHCARQLLRPRRECWIGHERRRGMAREVDLGNDRHVAGRRMRDDAAYLPLRVEAAVPARSAGDRIDVPGRRRACRYAPRPHARETRVLSDLEPPPLIVRQVPAKHVELVHRHPVDVAHDELGRLEVARRVEHQPAPGEARRIADRQRRQREFSSLQPGGAAQLPEGHRAVEESPRGARCDQHAGGGHVQPVALLPLRGSPIELEHDGCGCKARAGARAHLQRHAMTGAQQLCEIGRNRRGLRILRDGDTGTLAQHEAAGARGHARGRGNDARDLRARGGYLRGPGSRRRGAGREACERDACRGQPARRALQCSKQVASKRAP